MKLDKGTVDLLALGATALVGFSTYKKAKELGAEEDEARKAAFADAAIVGGVYLVFRDNIHEALGAVEAVAPAAPAAPAAKYKGAIPEAAKEGAKKAAEEGAKAAAGAAAA